MSSPVTIVTHNGTFHLDDLLCVSLIKILNPGKPITVVRTRDKAIIEKGDWVVDVGGIYDHATRRYDHHQHNSPVRDNQVPYAAFGLMWRHWGEVACNTIQAADLIEKNFIQMIDGPDNGVETSVSLIEGAPVPTISMIAPLFNIKWNEIEMNNDQQFEEATNFTKVFLERLILHYDSKVQSELEFAKIYNTSHDKNIIVVPFGVGPSTGEDYPEVKFLVAKDTENNNWKAKCITSEGFKCRVSFPKAWRGLNGDELTLVTGIKGSEFVHNGGFLAVATTKEGIVAMCRKAIDLAK